MVRTPYRCDPASYERHYCQRGGSDLPYFKGRLTQRGYGNIFSSLIRTAIPLVKSVLKSPIAKSVGKQALHTGKKLLGDIIVKKKPPKRAIKSRLNEAIQQRIDTKLAEMASRKRKGNSIKPYLVKKRHTRRDILDK